MSYIGEHAYAGRVAIVMRDLNLSEEEARSHIGSVGYNGRVNRVMRDRNLSEEEARSHIGSVGYNGRINRVMRDRNLSEEEARSRIGMGGYSATILAIMGVFGCSIVEARLRFSESGWKASAEARQIKDDRKQCQTEGCEHLQSTLNNPLCKQCRDEKTKKRKSGEIEIKERRCLICGESDKDRKFKGNTPYCQRCYKKPEGKLHRKERKEELYVLCSESDCTNIAWKDGKCQKCYNDRH
jgi:hypothetical protein